MKKLIALAVLALPLVSFADAHSKMDKMMSNMTVDQRIQMHEDMAKAHQDAADCLKASKPEMDCAKEFKMTMEQMHKKYFPNINMKSHCMMDGDK